ncbi:MAG: hypothetical protein IPM36_23740 [Lewinellaceae bacterium]|jgi:hypothetical protein|nr:hypothetical protein [Lewinellaceae bacterium]
MKNLTLGILFLSALSACVVPINSSFESARMLGKGNAEAMGHYSHYLVNAEGESEAVNNNFGLRLGYGISDRFDLKMRYIRLLPKEEGASGVNYLDLAPKVAIVPGIFAGTMPIGLYFAEDETQWVFSPKLLYTYPANNMFEATLAAKADIFPDDDGEVYLGFNLGFGMSQNLDRWAIRPELGFMVNPGESGTIWSFGIGFNAVLPGRNQ